MPNATGNAASFNRTLYMSKVWQSLFTAAIVALRSPADINLAEVIEQLNV